MKSKEEIRKIAEEKFPYDPFNEQLFNGFRTAKIEGFVLGFEVGRNLELEELFNEFKKFETFEDYLKSLE